MFEVLGEPVVSAKKAKPAGKTAKPSQAAWWKRPGVLAAAIGFSPVLILMTVIIIKMRGAIVVLEIDQPGAEVRIDGQKITVNVPGDNEPIEIKVEPGRHKLRISKAGFVVKTQDIELKSGKSPPIKIQLVREKAKPDDEGDEKWIREVAGLPSEEQVKAVAAKLRERNPGFDGKVTHEIHGGVVTAVRGCYGPCQQHRPVCALKGLESLTCGGSDPGKGKLADLSPLKGMPLTWLTLWGNPGIWNLAAAARDAPHSVGSCPCQYGQRFVAVERNEAHPLEPLGLCLGKRSDATTGDAPHFVGCCRCQYGQ